MSKSSLTFKKLPKLLTQLKKSRAVSLQFAIPFCDKFLHAFMENVIFTSVNLLSVLIIFSIPFNTKRIKEKEFFFWFSVENAPPILGVFA